MIYISKSPEKTIKIASKIASSLEKGGILCLFGELGSGKTTFTKGIAEGLKINKFSIKSPTYTYIRQYKKTDQNFYHIDLYRLDIIDELLWQEISELMQNKNNLFVIEWADRIISKISGPRIEVYLENLNENQRKISIKEIQ